MASYTIVREADFEYKTVPYEHQEKAFLMSRDSEAFALLMDMGTGKTKVALDTAAWLYRLGKISALLVIAPNHVHENWTRKEIPAHLPDWTNYQVGTYYSTPKAADRRAVEKLLEPTESPSLRVLAMNVEAFSGGANCKASKLAKTFLTRFPGMVCVDESTTIKTPGSKRRRTIQGLQRYSLYRRILTGTPVTKGPLDLYAQYMFLDKQILGYDNFTSFKARYAIYEREKLYGSRDAQGRPREYDKLVGYRNLDELKRNIRPYSYRVRKADCLDLPPKVYETREVTPSKEQIRLYAEICTREVYTLRGKTVDVNHVLSRLVRLQQVLGGYIPVESGEAAVPIFEDPQRNPRIKALLAILEETSAEKVIIWARFRAEIEDIYKILIKRYGEGSAFTYYGGHASLDDIDRFQEDETTRFMVGNQDAGQFGLTITAASTVVYYSNTFEYDTRLQSEDRAHRIGQTADKVTYIDLIGSMKAWPSIDVKIHQAIANKDDLASLITGDPAQWFKAAQH